MGMLTVPMREIDRIEMPREIVSRIEAGEMIEDGILEVVVWIDRAKQDSQRHQGNKSSEAKMHDLSANHIAPLSLSDRHRSQRRLGSKGTDGKTDLRFIASTQGTAMREIREKRGGIDHRKQSPVYTESP